MDGAFVKMLAFPPVFRTYHNEGLAPGMSFKPFDVHEELTYDIYHLRYINGKPRYDYAGVQK